MSENTLHESINYAHSSKCELDIKVQAFFFLKLKFMALLGKKLILKKE